MQRPVPKFGSFRPKVAKSSGEEAAQNSGASKPRSSKDQAHGSKSQYKDARHSPDAGAKEVTPPRDVFPSQNKETEELFIKDVKGDPDNLRYLTNSKYKVPLYRAPQESRNLGDELQYRRVRASGVSPLSSINRELKSSLNAESEYVAFGISSQESSVDSQPKDFLSLNPGKKRKRVTVLGASAKPYTGQEAFYTRTDHDAAGEEDSADSEAAASSENETATQESRLRQENARLSRLVALEPHNVQAWLAYIKQQDAWIQHEYGSSKNEQTPAMKRSIAETKLSLYSSALSKVDQKDKDRELLLLGQMEQGRRVWENKKLVEKWREVISNNQECLALQKEYLNFAQSNSPTFTFDECKGAFVKFLEILTIPKSLPRTDYAECRMHALLRLTGLMRDCGYLELARSTWQALIELNLFTVKNTRDVSEQQFQDLMLEFEQFWDSEQPRIGEKGAQGWRSAAEDQTWQDDVDRSEASPNFSYTDLSSWARKENESMSTCSKPSKSITVETEDDPYRVVLFSDIEPFLSTMEGEYRHFLVNAFLCFYRLPPLAGEESYPLQKWWYDPFLVQGQLTNDEMSLETSAQSSITTTENMFRKNVIPPVFSAFGDYAFSKEGKSKETAPTLRDCILNAEEKLFIRTVLRQLAHAFPSWIDLVEYHFAVELRFDPHDAIKVAKKMLQNASSNLRLYNAYGLIESWLDKTSAADRVFSTAIQMSASFPLEDRSDATLLRKTWVWEALRSGNTDTALERLLLENTGIMATREELQDERAAAIDKNRMPNAVHCSECIALLSYLTTSCDLSTAISTIRAESAILSAVGPRASFAVELLHQFQAQLISHHINLAQKPYSPALIRAAVRPSVISFPNNAAFLALYAANEARSRIDDRVRQLADEILLSPDSSSSATGHESGSDTTTVTVLAFHIAAELRRAASAHSGATPHSARAAFEKAVASKTGSRCPAIWTAYFMFEIRRGDLPGAKAVFLRGWSVLPWVKRFGMLAFEYLGDVIGEDELRGLYRIMVARGMRLHVTLQGEGD